MATWTELMGAVDASEVGKVELTLAPEIVRGLLLDLPHHPSVARLAVLTLTLDSGAVLELTPAVPLASGATSPGAKPPTTVPALHQRHTRNLLASAPVTAYTDDLEPGQAPPPAAPPQNTGWFDGITYRPAEKRSPGGIILETT